MSIIATNGSLIPNAVDTPLDARTRIAALVNIPDIEMPFVGMHFYVTGTGVEYIVKTLKSKTVGTLEVPEAQIDTYEAVPDAGDIEAVVDAVAGKADAADVATLAGVVAGKADAEDLEALAATVGTKVEDFAFTVAVDAETGAVTASYTPAGGSATHLTVSEDKQTITIPLSVLGISGLYTFFLFDSAGRLQANTEELSYQITGGDLLLTWGGGWTAGTWTLHAQNGKGEQGIQGIPGESGSTYAGWTTLTYAASIALSRSTEMKENQKLTLTGNVTLTAPTLSESYPLLLLEITTAGYAVSVGENTLIATSDSKYLVGWYWNGTETRRLAVAEVI